MSNLACLAAATIAAALTFLLAGVAPVAPAAGATAMIASGRPANISLTSFNIAPQVLHLKSGQPVLLRVANDSSVPHDLTAPEFFGAAEIGIAEHGRLVRGKVSLEARESDIISLVPKAGRYPIKCSHPLHKMLGMKGMIIVQ